MSFEHKKSEFVRPTLHSGPRFLVQYARQVKAYNPEARIIPMPDPQVDRQMLYQVKSEQTESDEGTSPTPELSENPSLTDKEK